jgi:hypothetical protein
MEKTPTLKNNSVLEKFRNFKRVLPVALATFLASCEGPNAVSPEIAKKVFENNPGLERVDVSEITHMREVFENLRSKFGDSKDILGFPEVVKLDNGYHFAIMNDSTLRMINIDKDIGISSSEYVFGKETTSMDFHNPDFDTKMAVENTTGGLLYFMNPRFPDHWIRLTQDGTILVGDSYAIGDTSQEVLENTARPQFEAFENFLETNK